MNTDTTYCNGHGCCLRGQCKRYDDGQKIKNGSDEGQDYWWMEHCEEETRDGYLPLNE